MEKFPNVKVLVLQIISFIGVLLVVFFLLSESSCNRTKFNENKSFVNALNDSKFEKIKDQKNAIFLVATAEIYLREIKLGQLAQSKAVDVDVKELGRMNETFYTHKFISLIKLAKSKSISIPTSPDGPGEKTFKNLASLSGEEFNEQYCDEMIKNQNQLVKFFQKINSETTDEEIKTWAIKALPDVEKQISYAVTCQTNIDNWNNFNVRNFSKDDY